ncbi:hypothetical protein [Leptospira noguchii]|uniref:hypothetical protein n=1 Tax=Leptospira noguchii TaxID=28182 RepID=UPI001FB7F8CF|nr:hypothetical protein [Leptospira noguchii]UOG55076.1 hypothetical protein MAL09_21760 [Leptospira noguchii]
MTRAESPAGCLWQAGFAPVFLCRTHVIYVFFNSAISLKKNALLLHLKTILSLLGEENGGKNTKF